MCDAVAYIGGIDVCACGSSYDGCGCGCGVAEIVNGLLMAAARKLGDKEFHDTLTEQEFSQAAKMSVGMVLNTAGVLYFIYATPKEWYQDGGPFLRRFRPFSARKGDVFHGF